MAKININDYTITIDQYNLKLDYNYKGEDKDGNEKDATKFIGYYTTNLPKGLNLAIKGIQKHHLSELDDSVVETLEGAIEAIELQQEDVTSWIERELGNNNYVKKGE